LFAVGPDVSAPRLRGVAGNESSGECSSVVRRSPTEWRLLSEDPSVSVDPKEIERKVIEIVCEHLAVNKEQVTRATNFIEDIGADSLDIVELIMELEEEFDIQIPDDQAEKIKTVGEAIDYIQRETEKK
jgi:acyl carrier protein